MLPQPSRTRWSRSLLTAGIAVCLISVAWVAPVLPGTSAALTNVAPAPAEASLFVEDGDTLSVFVSRSERFSSPWPVKGASLTDPSVADVQVLTPTMLLITGATVGTTDLVLWGNDGQSMQMRIEVSADVDHLSSELEVMFPSSKISVRKSGNVTVISGTLETVDQVKHLHTYLDNSGISYVDMTTMAGVQQVLVEVRMAEVGRDSVRAMGINFFKAGSSAFFGSTVGSSAGGPLNPISIGAPAGAGVGSPPFIFTAPTVVSPAVTMFAGFPKANLELFIQALAENDYLRILAEPTLVALSGESARFLAGGEFPIPIVQGGSGDSTAITIEYKEFGVALAFSPIVLGNGRIRLHVAAEVSDTTDSNGVQIQGFSIPGIVVRKVETTLELNSGQTFAMAGLLNERTRATSSRVPGLGSLPVIGQLFRSVRYQSGETELLIIVTASLVEPVSSTALPPLPGTDHIPPSDWEFYTLGRIEGTVPARLSPGDAQWLRDMGLDRLKGPGAWATHSQPDAVSMTGSRTDTGALLDEESGSAEASGSTTSSADGL